MTVRLLKPPTSPAAFTAYSPTTRSGWSYTIPDGTSGDFARSDLALTETTRLGFTYSTTGAGVPFEVFTEPLDGAGTVVGARVTSALLWAATAAQTGVLDLPALPAGAVSRRVGLTTISSIGSRNLTLAGVTLTGYAEAAEIIAAPISRDLRRTATDVIGEEDANISAGTPGKLSGSLTFLCDDLAQALALDAFYASTSPLTLSTGGALDGLVHVAIGTLRYGVERALPGKPPKWTLQAEIREV